jgi:hypothetical protein
MLAFPFPLFDCTPQRGEMMLFGLKCLVSVKLGVTGEVTTLLSDEFTFRNSSATTLSSPSTGLSRFPLLPQNMASRGLEFTIRGFNRPILGGLSI